jgi:hypothetical protein
MKAALIQAAPVVRDENGNWWHPDMPEFEEGQEAEWKAWVEAQGLVMTHGLLEHLDCDHPAYIAYYGDDLNEGGSCDFSAWVDEPPRGEGWFTLAICDTEDGPSWTWARRVEGGAV